MALVWFYIENMNYREKTHFENNFSINSSKYEKNLTIWFLFEKYKFYLYLWLLGVDDSVDNSQNRKCQVKLHSMLFHLMQANFKFSQNFHVFQRPQSKNTMYTGMVYQ